MKRKVLSLVLILSFIFSFPSGDLPSVKADPVSDWSTPINISNSSASSRYPSIAVDKNNNVHVVWEEQWIDETTRKFKRDIYYAKRDNNGWSPPVKISKTSMDFLKESSFPKIAVDSTGKVHVGWYAWYGGTIHGAYDTFVEYTSFLNPQDSQPVRLFNAHHVYAPNLALIADSKDKIHLIWVDNTGPGSLTDALKHSINQGGNWTTPYTIRVNWWGIHEIDAAIDSADNLHLAWVDADGWWIDWWSNVAYSIYNGLSWSTTPDAPVIVHKGNSTEWVEEVAVAVDTDNMPHVVWGPPFYPGRQLFYSQLDRGSWSAPYQLFTFSEGKIPFGPDLTYSSGNLHLVFSLTEPRRSSYLKYSSYNGTSWTEPTNISSTFEIASPPTIVSDNTGKLHLLCSGYEIGSNYVNIFYITSEGPAPLPNQPPVANAGEDQIVYVGDEVTFNGSGSYDPDGSIVKYEWDFDGNGTYDYAETSTDTPDGAFNGKTTHTYTNSGTYEIVLRVTDNGGAFTTDGAFIEVKSVVANAGPDRTVKSGELVAFGLEQPEIPRATYHWDFGDGTSANTRIATHRFTGEGDSKTYTVTLTVTDNRGQQATDTANITVLALQQKVEFYHPPMLPYPPFNTEYLGRMTATYLWQRETIELGQTYNVYKVYRIELQGKGYFIYNLGIHDEHSRSFRKRAIPLWYRVVAWRPFKSPDITRSWSTSIEVYNVDTMILSATGFRGGIRERPGPPTPIFDVGAATFQPTY